MTSVGTRELHQRHGLGPMTIHRLIKRGVFCPTGNGGSGNPWLFDAAEQRAVAAVAAFSRSHLMDHGRSPLANDLRHQAMRTIAESARTHQPGDPSVRWIMLLGDGTALRVSDELAASWPEPRTLIQIAPENESDEPDALRAAAL